MRQSLVWKGADGDPRQRGSVCGDELGTATHTETNEGGGEMIARVWRGAVRAEDEEAYATYLEETGMQTARALDGSRGTLVLHRQDGDTVEFVTLLLFDSLDHVRAFAGNEIEQAVFFPEDDRYLVERELDVRHYEVDEHRTSPRL